MFQCLFEAYVLAYPAKSRKICQEEAVQKWDGMKNDADLQVKVDHWLQELKPIAATHTKKESLLTFCAQHATYPTYADTNKLQKSACDKPREFCFTATFQSNFIKSYNCFN